MQIPTSALCLLVIGLVSSGVALPSVRERRDVSHLEYLPPVPSRDYLPPLIDVPQKLEEPEAVTPISNEYLPPAEVKLSNEYLPPAVEHTETPIDITTTEEPTTEAETTTTTTTTPEPTVELQDSAVLLDDGYHYKTPEVVPDLFTVEEPVAKQQEQQEAEEEQAPQGEYLPPLEEGHVVAEGPDNDESAVLADDGYHYRAIKRLRF